MSAKIPLLGCSLLAFDAIVFDLLSGHIEDLAMEYQYGSFGQRCVVAGGIARVANSRMGVETIVFSYKSGGGFGKLKGVGVVSVAMENSYWDVVGCGQNGSRGPRLDRFLLLLLLFLLGGLLSSSFFLFLLLFLFAMVLFVILVFLPLLPLFLLLDRFRFGFLLFLFLLPLLLLFLRFLLFLLFLVRGEFGYGILSAFVVCVALS